MKKSEKARLHFRNTVGLYAIQCGKCFKWRLISSKERYEEIRATMIEDPFLCEKEGLYCDNPAEIECEPSRLWVFDKPNIPKPPAGFNREVILRKDLSKFDSYYETPTGKKVRAPAEVEKFLDANPKYRDDGVSVSSFNFTVPKITENMIPIAVRKDLASGNKRSKPSKTHDDQGGGGFLKK